MEMSGERFGGCSLITTLYVWFPACWAPVVADRLFSWMPSPNDTAHTKGRPASGPPSDYSETPPWHHGSYSAAAACDAMEENDSTEVQCKIRQWSLPGDTIVPVLNVTSRVFWLELDDKASWTAMGCCRRASYVRCSRRSVPRRGRELVERDLQWRSCCLAVRTRGIGSISSYRKRICGLHYYPELSQKNSLCESING